MSDKYLNKPGLSTLVTGVKELISRIPKFAVKVVDSLPTTEISETTVYLVKTSETETGNLYTEYLRVNEQWEELGTQKFDLSDYAKLSDLGDGTITIKQNSYSNYFSLNSENDTTIELPTIYDSQVQVNINGTSAGGFTLNASSKQTLNLTDAKVAQTETSTNGSYEMLFAGSTGSTNTTENVRKSSYLYYNPSTAVVNIKKNEGRFQVVSTDGNYACALMVGSSGTNRGLYDCTNSKWMVYSNSSGVITLNGNAATATKLATARTINGVSFDGSANIEIPLQRGKYKDVLMDSGTDLNDCKDLQTRYVSENGTKTGTLVNVPVNLGGCVVINELRTNSGATAYIYQYYYPNNNADLVYMRSCSSDGSTWTDWVQPTAGKANQLTTARKINGVSFDGTSDITIPDNNDKVTQTETSTNASYEVLFAGSTGNTTATEGAGKSSGFTYNPSTHIFNINGQTYNIQQAYGWNTTANALPVIRKADGVMEIGEYIDFHEAAYGNTDYKDYDVRVYAKDGEFYITNSGNVKTSVHANLIGNADTATKATQDANGLQIDTNYMLVSRGTAIPSGADLDTYTTPGVYYAESTTLANSLVNKPSYANGGGRLEVYMSTAAITDGQYLFQEYKQCSPFSMYTWIRTKHAVTNGWTPWHLLNGLDFTRFQYDGSDYADEKYIKVATYKVQATSNCDHIVTFNVQCNYTDGTLDGAKNGGGILRCHLRRNSATSRSLRLTWLQSGNTVVLTDWIMAYDEDNSQYELWKKVSKRWESYTVTVLSSSTRTVGDVYNNSITMYYVKTSGADAYDSTTYDAIVTSTLGDIKANTLNGDLVGNADTSTKLATARNIQGVSFDGSEDITLFTAGDNITIADDGTIASTTISRTNSTSGTKYFLTSVNNTTEKGVTPYASSNFRNYEAAGTESTKGVSRIALGNTSYAAGVAGNSAGQIMLYSKYDDTIWNTPIIVADGSYTSYPIRTRLGDSNGCLLAVGCGGLTTIGGGESVAAYGALEVDTTLTTDTGSTRKYGNGSEQLLLMADSGVYAYSSCNTIANRKVATLLDTSGNTMFPGIVTASTLYASSGIQLGNATLNQSQLFELTSLIGDHSWKTLTNDSTNVTSGTIQAKIVGETLYVRGQNVKLKTAMPISANVPFALASTTDFDFSSYIAIGVARFGTAYSGEIRAEQYQGDNIIDGLAIANQIPSGTTCFNFLLVGGKI